MDDMKGKIFAFGDLHSTSGYLIPAVELSEAGYDLEAGIYFSDLVFSGGHKQIIKGVYNGKFDAGVT